MDDDRNQSPHHPDSPGHGSGAKHALGATVAGAAAVGVAALGIGLAGADEPEITPADAASPDPVVQTVDDSWDDQGPVYVDGDAGGPVYVDGDAGARSPCPATACSRSASPGTASSPSPARAADARSGPTAP